MKSKTTCTKATETTAKSSKAGKKYVTFAVKAEPGASVYVAGTFNDWDMTATPLKDAKGNGEFSCKKMLAAGRYEYKFIINGIWDVDAANPDFVANDCGSMNSVITVE